MRSAVAGKPRVHELAKELGVESKIVLARLKEMGEFVKSASSTVEAPVARRLREVFVAAPAPAPAPPAATVGEPMVSAKPTPPKKASAKPKAPVPAPPAATAPVAKPASAHDIEVAAAEARAAALKAEQEAAVKAARAAQQRDTIRRQTPGDGDVPPTPGPAVPARPGPMTTARPTP